MRKIILGICDESSVKYNHLGSPTYIDIVKLIILNSRTEQIGPELPVINLKPNEYNLVSPEVLYDLLCPENQKYLLVPGERLSLPEEKTGPLVNEIKMNSLIIQGSTFTRRQREILELFIEGLVCKQITYKLNISPHTLKNHLSKIYRKMDVKGIEEAIPWYREYKRRMN